MRFTLTVGFIFLAATLLAQPEWGVRLSPMISKGRLPAGVGVGYAGPPFFSGDLTVTEGNETGFSLEVYRAHKTRFKNVSIRNAVGFTTCKTYQHFDYDYANSINNIVSIENRFHFLTFTILPHYNFKLGNVIFYGGMGPHLN